MFSKRNIGCSTRYNYVYKFLSVGLHNASNISLSVAQLFNQVQLLARDTKPHYCW